MGTELIVPITTLAGLLFFIVFVARAIYITRKEHLQYMKESKEHIKHWQERRDACKCKDK